MSPLFSKGTQPKLTKTDVLQGVLLTALWSDSNFLVAVIKGANTKYPSFPSLYLLTKNLSSLNHPLIFTTLYSQSLKVLFFNQG